MSKKRKISEDSAAQFKTKVSKLLIDSPNIELREFKQFTEGKFQTIWIRSDENQPFKEQVGFLFCNHESCKEKRTKEKVIIEWKSLFKS